LPTTREEGTKTVSYSIMGSQEARKQRESRRTRHGRDDGSEPIRGLDDLELREGVGVEILMDK